MSKLPFKRSSIEEIERIAKKSMEEAAPSAKTTNSNHMLKDISEASQAVLEYFKDSPAILISSVQQLHEYVDKIIEYGYAGIDTETTGLDRIKDTIVGASLCVPGMPECYIPNRHIIPIFNELYANQLTYEQVHNEFQRLVDNKVKLIFANADFDLSMIYKDYEIDFNSNCYFDVILAWRCLRENEPKNDLKTLYNKYVLGGKGDPKRFSDFFSPAYFPYCRPEIAKLYAANDAKITFELFLFELQYLLKTSDKCKAAKLESLSELVWNVEFPLIDVCQRLHRMGIYLDKTIANRLQKIYGEKYNNSIKTLQDMVQKLLDTSEHIDTRKQPFKSGKDFNPQSTIHVKYLCYDILQLPEGKDGRSTDKEILANFNLPITNQILKVRSLNTLISTFVDKLPKSTTPDSRIHATFKQIGAKTGRLSSAEPNLQNIPSHAEDIRHIFRATPSENILKPCECDETTDMITAILSKFDTVTTDNGDVRVDRLTVGNAVKLVNGKSEVYKIIKDIQPHDINSYVITF